MKVLFSVTFFTFYRPLNMLDSFENRNGYMLAFGLAANSIIDAIIGGNNELIGEDMNKIVERETSRLKFLKGRCEFLND